MSSVALVLTAASLALTPPVDLKLADGPLTIPSTAPGMMCGADTDPQFVRFVPEAPAVGGHNALLRLISEPAGGAKTSSAPPASLRACKEMLTRNGAPR